MIFSALDVSRSCKTNASCVVHCYFPAFTDTKVYFLMTEAVEGKKLAKILRELMPTTPYIDIATALHTTAGWLCGTEVERRSSAGELPLSCA